MLFPTMTTWSWVVAAIFFSFAIVVRWQRHQKYPRLPPGPTPLPIIGNIIHFPRKHLGREFAALSNTFGTRCYSRRARTTVTDVEVMARPGDVIHLDMLGQHIIVLGSLKAARDLLDKRSANYSDRPTSVMVQLWVDFCLSPIRTH